MRRDKWLWTLIVVNIVIASLLVLTIRAVLLLIGIAAYVTSWPLFVLLLVGLALSVVGLLVAKRTDSRVPRNLGLVINGATLLLHSTIIVGLIGIFIGIQRERFLIPEGYQGDIYVIHSVEDGEPEQRMFRQVTYHIPPDGILRTQGPLERGLTRSTYYYQHRDGTLERIRYTWLTTVHRTPENLADDKDFGVFFPRTGNTWSSDTRCSIVFEQFYVGTKANLLSGYQQKDLGRYLREHPSKCSGQPN
jgi:hypothetical protein